MSVDTATVKRIASLARIAITHEDAARMAPELGNILGWIEMLEEVDTTGIEPMTAVIPNTLRLRDDVVNADPLTGGGIRDWDDVKRLEDAGADAVLVASALHDGTLTFPRPVS